jgi:hypothetical protein
MMYRETISILIYIKKHNYTRRADCITLMMLDLVIRLSTSFTHAASHTYLPYRQYIDQDCFYSHSDLCLRVKKVKRTFNRSLNDTAGLFRFVSSITRMFSFFMLQKWWWWDAEAGSETLHHTMRMTQTHHGRLKLTDVKCNSGQCLPFLLTVPMLSVRNWMQPAAHHWACTIIF